MFQKYLQLPQSQTATSALNLSPGLGPFPARNPFPPLNILIFLHHSPSMSRSPALGRSPALNRSPDKERSSAMNRSAMEETVFQNKLQSNKKSQTKAEVGKCGRMWDSWF